MVFSLRPIKSECSYQEALDEMKKDNDYAKELILYIEKYEKGYSSIH